MNSSNAQSQQRHSKDTVLIRYGLAVVVAGLLSACSGGGEGEVAGTGGLFSGRSGSAQCLLAAKQQPCDILDEALVRGAAAGADVELTTMANDIGGASCTVRWAAGRKTTIDLGVAGKMETEVDDEVGLSGIVELADSVEAATARFATATRTRSAEEQRQFGESAASRVSETKAIASENQEMAQDFARSLASNLNYEAQDGVGDAAAWGGVGRFKQLMVRVGRVQFGISANVADDEATNREMAVTVAQAVIARCE